MEAAGGVQACSWLRSRSWVEHACKQALGHDRIGEEGCTELILLLLSSTQQQHGILRRPTFCFRSSTC